MTYHYLDGVSKKQGKRGKKWIILPVAFVLIGLYALANSLSPKLPPTVLAQGETVAQRLVREQPGESGDRLYIPKLNISVAIVQDDMAPPKLDAWWRSPENGNPKDGGNFALSAPRFQLGLTPQETRSKSLLYHIGLLQEEDEIYVDFEGVRYVYKVSDKHGIPANLAELQQRSDESKLTLYASDSRGEVTGDVVIEAKPVGTVAWGDNPQLVPLNALN